jgi:glycosyltransferase involved in cell wall biosynthesis
MAQLHQLTPALNVVIIPNGVEADDAAPEARQPALLFVGNYAYAPNADAARRLARDILPRVRAQFPGVQLWLVGANPPGDLSALASDTIHVTGWVDDVRPYYRRAALFVSPLAFGAGMKNKVLEAMACGCPVVGSSLSFDGMGLYAMQEAIPVEGDPRDAAEFARFVCLALADDDLRARVGANGRKLAETRYSWAQVAAQYEMLYTDVISQNAGHHPGAE